MWWYNHKVFGVLEEFNSMLAWPDRAILPLICLALDWYIRLALGTAL